MTRMKLFFLAVLACLAFCVPARAELTTSIVFSVERERPVAVSYRTRADYIVLAVAVTSDERDFAAKLLSVQKAKNQLMDRLREKGQVVVHEGPTTAWAKGGGMSSYGRETWAPIMVLLPVVSESDNIFSGGAELTRMVEEVEPPGKGKYTVSTVGLAMDDPEKLRGAILDLIRQDLEAAREKLKGSGKITVSGLENPVRVVQVDDLNVELFIEYTMSVEVQ